MVRNLQELYVTITKKEVGNPRKDGTRRESWEVYCRPPRKGKTIRRYCNTEEEAQKVKLALLKAHYQSYDITEKEYLDAENAIIDLKRCESVDAKKAGIRKLVQWAIENYIDTTNVLSLNEYKELYEKARKNLDPDTVENDRVYLKQLCEIYGHLKPTEIDVATMSGYLENEEKAKWHRDKVIRQFYNWLCGKCNSRTEPISFPIMRLDKSPFYRILRPIREEHKIGTDGTTQTSRNIVMNQIEVIKAIKAGFQHGCAEWVVFLLYTGIRPGLRGELKKFWTTPGLGWNNILMRRNQPKIIIPNRIEKTRSEQGTGRETIISDNFFQWLEFFKKNSELFPFDTKNLRKKLEAVKRDALPREKRRVKDIWRHTFITHLLIKTDSIVQTCLQTGTSERMIRDHYYSDLPKTHNERFFQFYPDKFPETNKLNEYRRIKFGPWPKDEELLKMKKTMSNVAIAQKLGVKPEAVRMRIKRMWPKDEELLEMNKTMGISEIAQKLARKEGGVRKRIKMILEQKGSTS